MKRLIQDSTKKSDEQKCFQGRAYFFFFSSLSLSPFFFLLSRGLEKRFGREEKGWFQAPAFPRAPLRKGEGFLPTQPSVTFYEQQDPRAAPVLNPGEDSV
jgi:hypothetical protein